MLRTDRSVGIGMLAAALVLVNSFVIACRGLPSLPIWRAGRRCCIL